MKKLLALLLLFLPISARATTTVTGSLKNIGTGVVTGNSFVRFWLRGCQGAQPRVNGTAVIAPSQGGIYFQDFIPDVNGNISGTVYSTRNAAGTGNGEIECPSNIFTAAFYGIQLFIGGKGGTETPVAAKIGATLNITNVTPLTAAPVVIAPTGDTTYIRLDGGNSPVTGAITFTGANTHSGTETFTGALNSNNLTSGNVANKPATGDALLFVTNNGNDSNDGKSWGTAKLTIAGACAALTGGNSSCTAGSGTIMLAPLFSGTITQPATTGISILAYSSTSVIGGQNWFALGKFDNSAMFELAENDINALNAKTEFQRVQGNTNFATDALSGAVATPTGATEHNVNAVAGYANTSSSAQGTGGTVGGYFQCTALVNSSKCWGGNMIGFDASGLTTGVLLEGAEIDLQPQNASSAYSSLTGTQISLFTPTAGTMTGSRGLVISHGQTGLWDTGIFIDNGNVANFAAVFGASCSSGSCSTALVQYKSLNAGSQRLGYTFLDSSGNFNIQVPNGANLMNYIFNTGVSGNFTGTFTNGITANRVWTLQDVTGTLAIAQQALNFDAVYGTYRVTTDQTITAGASLTAIPGLSWTMPANTALNVKFTCDLLYSQATAAASDSFGIQDVTVAPTNIEAKEVAYTSATALSAANIPTLTTTTATAFTAFTPSAATTVFNATIDGMIEQPSNAATSVVQIMAQFSTNNGTIKRGSSCQVY